MPFFLNDLAAQEMVTIPRHLTLETACGLLIRNPLLVAQRLRVEVEKGDLIDADRYPNPDFEFAAEGIVFDSERGGFMNRLQPSFVLRQEIVMGGKREKRSKVEGVDIEIARKDGDDRLRSLTFELKQTYYEVVLAQEELKVAREILDQFDGVIRLNQIRFEQGEISGGELRRLEAARYQLLEDTITIEVQLQNAKIHLLATIGVNNLDQDFVAIDPFDSSFVPPPLERLEAIAFQSRPDLAGKRARVKQAEWAIDLEKAKGVPNIVPFAGYQRELDASGPVLGLSVPLFVFNRNQGGISRAEAEKQLREAHVRFQQILVSKEVRLAMSQLEGDRRRIRALEGEYLAKARQSRDITESAYRLGATSLVDFLDAERTYRETSRLYNRALFDYQVSRAALELAIGVDL
jgi:cobalt-zinc-cadmium efflux system outer membrane protein